LPYKNFLHKKNFCIILTLEIFVTIVYKILDLFGIPGKRKSNSQTVLFIEPAHLGDTLLTTPSIRLLKEKRKELIINCLVSPEGKAGLSNNPNVESIYTINLPWYKNDLKYNLVKQIFPFLKLIKLFRAINPQIAINVRNTSYHREHLAMWFAGIPERIGYGHKGFSFLLTTSVPFSESKQTAQLKLDIITYWLGIVSNDYSLRPDYFYPKNNLYKVKKILEEIGLPKDNKKIVAINPGAQHSFLWGKEYYIKLCNLINNQLNAEIIFLGTRNFVEYIEEIQKKLSFKTISVAGMTTLDEAAAFLNTADLLITVDTGLRYITSANGIKTIVLKNGADSVIEFGKHVETEVLVINKVECSPCGKSVCRLKTMECMNGIMPEMVFNEVKKILQAEILK